MSQPPSLGFVIPWFGFDIPGGAESFCRDLAVRLAGRGYPVEILTTCARQLDSNWNQNFHRAGVSAEQGLTIRRFPVTPGDHALFNHLNQRLLSGDVLGPSEELSFIGNIINSSALTQYVASHRTDYHFFLIPYMFGTTYFAAQAAGDRGILVPCLHDEPYARFGIFRKMFEEADALLFNSQPEARLANRLFNLSRSRHTVLGIGVEIEGNPAPRSPVPGPFVLYLGRKDSGKNVPLLVGYFAEFKKRNPSPLKLVLVGNGDSFNGEDCIDLGYVDPATKLALLRDAVCLCQPSNNESFSKVIMEAWLMGNPVLVHGRCEVTRDHVVRAQGGLYFQDFFDFEAGLEFLLGSTEVRKRFAAKGKDYVEFNYSWHVILDRFDDWYAGIQSSTR